jgi:hypothetical protein
MGWKCFQKRQRRSEGEKGKWRRGSRKGRREIKVGRESKMGKSQRGGWTDGRIKGVNSTCHINIIRRLRERNMSKSSMKRSARNNSCFVQLL